MRDLEIFTRDGQELRARMIDGGPRIVLADICSVLDIKEPSVVRRRLPEGVCETHPLQTAGGTQNATWVTEAGFYRVVLRSNSPKAEPFIQWVTEDVLPTIRKTGRYGSDVGMLATLPSSQVLALAAEAAKRAEDAEADRVAAERRAIEAEGFKSAIEANDGIAPRTFHKKYFSDTSERKFFEVLYERELLIDQRGARGRGTDGRLRNGQQHGHPAYKGKPFFYLHATVSRDGDRHETARVRPGDPELALVAHLSKWLAPSRDTSPALERSR